VFLATGGAAVGFPYYEERFSIGPVGVEVLAQALDLPTRYWRNCCLERVQEAGGAAGQ
jgi:hypothetical protein